MVKGKNTRKRKKRKTARSNKTKRKNYKVRSNVTSKYTCELVICRHEKCHHCKFITVLQIQKKKYNINFFASLLPYNSIFHPTKYGIIKGMPDFFIPLKCRQYNGLYIELKVGSGVPTKLEKVEIKKIIDDPDFLVGVCYGWKDCKKLMIAYRDKVSNEKLEKCCWNGKIKKVYFD